MESKFYYVARLAWIGLSFTLDTHTGTSEAKCHKALVGLDLAIAKDDLELMILLPPPRKCWNYGCLWKPVEEK